MTADLTSVEGERAILQFLWMELTNQCNLQCSHCYAESGPYTAGKDVLSSIEYRHLIVDAYQAGCRQIQFIGGEPTLNADLPGFIQLCSDLGYTFIEVFTNLTRLSDELVSCFKRNNVSIATSLYASVSEIHDSITTLPGSFARTVNNILKLSRANIPVRVGIIEMPQNSDHVPATIRFLSGLGIGKIGTDRVRGFGRAGMAREPDMAELCGQCAENILCVGSNGRVSPCIMSKHWTVGSVLDAPLSELLISAKLTHIRNDIYRATVQRQQEANEKEQNLQMICDPKTCGPYSSCTPTTGPGPCAPNGCTPCFPKG